MKKIGIFGDSFGVSAESNSNIGWSRLLEANRCVTNFCQCGIGEYKILNQIKSSNLLMFDAIIISHTSPFRVHTRDHPVHKDSTSHSNCDIIFSDIEHRKDPFSVVAQGYFKMVFDPDYYKDIHNLICQEIHSITQSLPTIHITHFDYKDLYPFDGKLVNFYPHWQSHRGDVNHYSALGNQYVAEQLEHTLLQT